MIRRVICYFVFVLLTVIVRVNSQICHGVPQYDRCSTNGACGCFHMAGAIDVGICAFEFVDCSELNRCDCTTNRCNEPDHICVLHPKCHNSPICYPVPSYNKNLCPPITTTNTTITCTTATITLTTTTATTVTTTNTTQQWDTSESENSGTSQPYNTTRQTTSKQELSTDTPNQESSSVGTLDDEDLVSTFFNDDAGKSNITNASEYDQYGNPTGSKYDLCRDGAYTQFNILIGQFYADGQFNDAAMKKPIDALKVKGFQVKHVKTENECITELASNRYQIAWIISTDRIQNSLFISALTTFHSSGGAIFLFADNTPYVQHASEFLKTKFGITVEGNYYGEKTLTYQDNGHQQKGHFGQHEIFTGITSLFEGSSISHPVYSTPASRNAFVTLATATDGNICIAVHDPPTTSNEGRLCLDTGFTKLYVNWDSAGTARYIVNVNCWLLGIEKRSKSKKKNENKK